MLVSQKSQYALRAIYELARRDGQSWTKISDVADAQAIPLRFLEVILAQLKQGGFVTSKRGVEGGYALVAEPTALTVGQVLRFIQGPVGSVQCVTGHDRAACPLDGGCAFRDLWERVEHAISDIYDGTTFQDLLDAQTRRNEEYVPCYSI